MKSPARERLNYIGDNMFAILLVLINVTITILSIYIFDFQVDGAVNNVYVILLSLFGGFVVTVLLLGLFLQLFYLVSKKNAPQKSLFMHKIGKQIVSVPIHYSNMKIKVIGEENLPKDPGFAIYVNHTSWIDLPVLMYKLYNNPVASLGKEEAFNMFMIGKFAPKYGCVMIDRDNPRKGAQAIKQVVNNVQNGFTMVIFPEGTRNREIGSLLDFRPGAFKVALRSGKPLVPMTIVKPKNFNSIKWPFRKRVTLVIHKPIPFDEFKSLKTIELSQQVKAIIESALNTIY